MPTYQVATPGTWDDQGSEITETTYQWHRGATAEDEGTPIPGATGVTYEAESEAEAYYVRVAETVTNAGGSTTSLSNAIEVPALPALPPINLTPPVIEEI